MSKDDGGPAFPYSALTPEGPQIYGDSHGMSLRDWFAGQALTLGGEFFHGIDDCSDPPNEAEHCARIAYAIADQMLNARKDPHATD